MCGGGGNKGGVALVGSGLAPVQIDKLNQKNVVDALKTLITPA